MARIGEGAKWALMTLEENLLYLVITFAEMERKEGKSRWTIWVYHNPKEFGICFLETWGCAELSTFSKDWKRANESQPGEKDSKAM